MRIVAAAWLMIAVSAAVAADTAEEWVYPVTLKGKPAAGVKVGVVMVTYPAPGEPRPGEPIYGKPVFATSDAKGDIRYAGPEGRATHALFLARDTDGRAGYGRHFGKLGHNPPTIDLRDNTELSGRIVDGDGKPVPGLKLKAVALGPDSFARFGRPVSFADTADWFWEKFPVAIKADGSFTLGGVPVEHSVAMKFEAPGFGSGRLWVMPGKSTPITLRKAGAIRLIFDAQKDAKTPDIEITATRTAAPDYLEGSGRGVAKPGGPLVIGDLPPGEYQIEFPYTGPAAQFPKPVGRVTVKPGVTTDVSVAIEPAARLTAKLVDSKTGTGVPGATLSVHITRGPGQQVLNTTAAADREGNVDLLVPPGLVSVGNGSASGYVAAQFGNNLFNRHITSPRPIVAGKLHDFGSFVLVKTVELAGVVVDESDRPVARATVSVGYSCSNFGSANGKTDTAGRFTIGGLNPEGGVVGITARAGKQITAGPVAVDPGRPEGEVRVVVSEKFAARLRFRAVDRAGKPVSSVGVELMHSVMYLNRGGGVAGSGTGGRVGATNDDGRFETEVLQPGDRYTISLSAPGYRGAPLNDYGPKPGETHDFGNVVLSRSDLIVAGTVTDLTGKPIPGARVFDNADGVRPVEAKTDAAGRFTLVGLCEGPAFVSVRADGFRLVTASAVPGGQPVAISLRKTTDPPAAPPVIGDEHRAAALSLGRHVIETMWKHRVEAGDDGKTALRAMARLDPATARKWLEEEETRTHGKTELAAELATAERERILLKTARDDSDEAVALLKPLEGAEGFRAVCDLAGQLLSEAPEKSLRIAEEAVARARGMEDSSRVWALAQAGELVWRAGRKDAGRKIVEEAAKLAEPIGFAELDGYRRGMAASRVALYDPAKCREMIDPMKDARDFNRWLAKACACAAEHDPALARRWLGDFRTDNSFAQASAGQWIAHRVFRSDPDQAIAIARTIEERTTRATTLTGLALRIKDRDRAAKLIDSAMEAIVADPTGYYNGGASGTAAIILVRARELGHPGLATLRDMVLAARPAAIPGYASRANGPQVQDALALALVDPGAARTILDSRLEPGDLTDVERVRNRVPLLAFTLADPAAARPVVDELFAVCLKRKKGFERTGLDTLATVLSQPDRLAEAALRAGDLLGDFVEE